MLMSDADFKLTVLPKIILELLCIGIFPVCRSWLSNKLLPVSLWLVICSDDLSRTSEV